jgi:hypothetical protein
MVVIAAAVTVRSGPLSSLWLTRQRKAQAITASPHGVRPMRLTVPAQRTRRSVVPGRDDGTRCVPKCTNAMCRCARMKQRNSRTAGEDGAVWCRIVQRSSRSVHEAGRARVLSGIPRRDRTCTRRGVHELGPVLLVAGVHELGPVLLVAGVHELGPVLLVAGVHERDVAVPGKIAITREVPTSPSTRSPSGTAPTHAGPY